MYKGRIGGRGLPRSDSYLLLSDYLDVIGISLGFNPDNSASKNKWK